MHSHRVIAELSQKPAVGACGRDRGVTILVRVDVSSGSAGVLAVTLSHQAAGFAP